MSLGKPARNFMDLSDQAILTHLAPQRQ